MVLLDAGGRRQEPQTAARVVEPLPALRHGEVELLHEALGRTGDALDGGEVIARDQLGGPAGRLGPDIGGKIAQREIDLVPDGGDDGHGAGRDRPHQRLLVESPQVLDAAAPAADDEQVENAQRLGRVQHCHQLGRRALALHLGGQHDQPAGPAAARQNADEVLHRRASRRRDEPDGARQERQRLLALRREQALSGQPLLEFFQLLLEPPGTVLDQGARDELVLAARLVDVDLTIGEHLQAIAELHSLPGRVAAEQHTGELGAGVLEGEINVAAGLRPEVGHLAAHPTRRHPTLQHLLHPPRELRDRLDPAGVGQRVVSFIHGVFFRV